MVALIPTLPQANDLPLVSQTSINPAFYSSGSSEKIPEQDCCICLLTLKSVDKKVIQISCTHFFHHDCIKSWIASSSNNHHACPICRTELSERSLVLIQSVFQRFLQRNQNCLGRTVAIGVALIAISLSAAEFFAVSRVALFLERDAQQQREISSNLCKKTTDPEKQKLCEESNSLASLENALAILIPLTYLYLSLRTLHSRIHLIPSRLNILPPILGAVTQRSLFIAKKVFESCRNFRRDVSSERERLANPQDFEA